MTGGVEQSRLQVVVHEVRSPVAALAAIAHAFAELDSDAPAREELVHLAITACRGIERIVVDVMTTSVRLETLDPTSIVREVAAAATLGGASIETRVGPDLPRISGDPLRLRQALDNLIANAHVHSGSAAPVVVGATAEGASVRLYVSDSGIGISEPDQERILQAGVRLRADVPGSGLGLAFVRAVAEAHGGRLVVASAPGTGATFTLVLPAA